MKHGKLIRKYFDRKTGKSYEVSVYMGTARWVFDGSYADEATTERIVKAVRSRMKAQANAKARDQAMRDLGLVKVRGPVTGKIYWE